VRNDVPTTVGGAAVLRRSFAPIEIAEPNPAKQIETKFFEIHRY
jgi:hypothetical protein